MKTDRMGVFYVMAHLLITLAVLGVYAYSVAIGHPDDTARLLLYTIVGYWFGAVGLDKIKPSQPSAPSQPTSQPVAPVAADSQAGGEKING